MRDREYIRKNFQSRFRKLATDKGIRVVDDWVLMYPSPLNDDPVLANWISEGLKKTLRVQEDYYDDDGTFQLGGFVAKTGLDYEYDNVCVIAVSSNEKVREIFELYKLWFIEDISPKEMERVLESYSELFNSTEVGK